MNVSAPGPWGHSGPGVAWGGDAPPAASQPCPGPGASGPLLRSGLHPAVGPWNGPPFHRACLQDQERRKGADPSYAEEPLRCPHLPRRLPGVRHRVPDAVVWSAPGQRVRVVRVTRESREKVPSGPAAPREQECDGVTASGRDTPRGAGDNEGSGHVCVGGRTTARPCGSGPGRHPRGHSAPSLRSSGGERPRAVRGPERILSKEEPGRAGCWAEGAAV